MTTHYVYSGAAGANNGTSWTDAYTTFEAAVTAATGAGDVIKIHVAHAETLPGSAQTFTFYNNVNVICVDKDNSDALAEMNASTQFIGYPSTSYSVSFASAAYSVYIRGVAFKLGSNSTANMNFAWSDGSQFIVENCKLWTTTGASNIQAGLTTGTVANSYAKFKDCSLKFGNTAQRISLYNGKLVMERCVIDSAGTSPATLFEISRNGASTIKLIGCDLSFITGTLIPSETGKQADTILVNCKLGSGVTVMAAQTPSNLSTANVLLLNCASGDTHYHIAHYDSLGSTVVSSSIYCNDNPTYDGTNKCSWVVTSSSVATFYSPYISPWISKYHSATSAITPYLEVLRDGSATAYQNDEVWAEFSYQGTSGSPLALFSQDRMAVLGTPADQASSSKAGSDWTGENATAWFGKIDSGSAITPAEIGHLSARVCIGEPSITVYVDPQIRT